MCNMRDFIFVSIKKFNSAFSEFFAFPQEDRSLSDDWLSFLCIECGTMKCIRS